MWSCFGATIGAFCITVPFLFTLRTCINFFVSFIFVLQWKVRRTLAFSIHELALVLGSEITRIELVPTFNSFLKDLDEVRAEMSITLY